MAQELSRASMAHAADLGTVARALDFSSGQTLRADVRSARSARSPRRRSPAVPRGSTAAREIFTCHHVHGRTAVQL